MLEILVKDSFFVDLIDPHFTGCVNDPAFAKEYTGMHDPFIIVKKSEVTR